MKKLFGLFALLFVVSAISAPAEITPAAKAKLDAMTKEIGSWAANPVIVDAVKAHNKGKSPELGAMTQEQWAAQPVTSKLIRDFTVNAAAEVLKEKRTEVVTEAFISGEDGTKVAFLAKPSNWNHKGKPKHDVPMSGKNWEGKVEVDESTGFSQVQIAVPVLDAGKPIGSLVVGINVTKLGG